VRLLLRGGGCEEAALRMIRPICRLLARREMNRPAGHLYSNKRSRKAHQSAMVATPDGGGHASISASEVKQTCCGGGLLRPLALWRMRTHKGHLHSSERACSEHRFMLEAGRSGLEHASISVTEGPSELPAGR